MDSRRAFIKKSVLLSGAAGLASMLPESVQRALAIEPEAGSTYMDAEHVVILMQENRSFDHCFGTMKGVRGFNDPHAVTLPNGHPTFLQTNAEGDTYGPFRLDIKDTNATWMGSLPHSRTSQVDAHNKGRYDNWLTAKRSSHNQYTKMPLTMGHYNREDLPFNYALADAFTVCDQNFCSAMTSTWPNRLFFWTGTVREQQNGHTKANIRNEDLGAEMAHWRTFPELLEKNNIGWNVYQNDISTGGGYGDDERAWLANFGCNPLEWFAQYNVKFDERYMRSLSAQAQRLPAEIAELQSKMQALNPLSPAYQKMEIAVKIKEDVLNKAKTEFQIKNSENFNKLSAEQKSIHKKAFSKNNQDPFYKEITTLDYKDGNTDRKVTVPKGDVLHRFRNDVNTGKLPAVSWIVGPQNFSDHPTAPWYGAWYVSEIIDILTKNPEVWKKTIFIMTYDENDGYFDHVPPFTPPDMADPSSGKCSASIDTSVEFIRVEQELGQGLPPKVARGGAIGLGYRVPMIIASPWSRGGQVCSEVFDHTSTLQFLEGFLNKKYNKNIRTDNISEWRRTVCGDLTSVFNPQTPGEKYELPFLNRNDFVETIHKARFKKEPATFKRISDRDAKAIAANPELAAAHMSQQEPGVKPSCALPYELYAEGQLSADKKHFELSLAAGNVVFGKRTSGSPFNVYAPTQKLDEGAPYHRSYAVAAGDQLKDTYSLNTFDNHQYQVKIHGPNGFLREFKGSIKDPLLQVSCNYENQLAQKTKLTGNLILNFKAGNDNDLTVIIKDNAYKAQPVTRKLSASKDQSIVIQLGKSSGWYDLSVVVEGYEAFEKRYAGRVETGAKSITDPLMGRLV
jgi:phospholipase C